MTSAGAAVGAAGAMALVGARTPSAAASNARGSRLDVAANHSVWVWQFSIDGTVNQIAADLAPNSLAAVVKTHDGLDWMATYDRVPGAIDGPREVELIATIFEDLGVPFHAWCVIRGVDVVR